MAARQMVKTQKRIVYLVTGETATVGLTASAFCDMGTTEGRALAAGSGITAASAAVSQIMAGAPFHIGMDGATLFAGTDGHYAFERCTLHSAGANPGGTAIIACTGGSVLVEFVL